jgi:predicted secreted protein
MISGRGIRGQRDPAAARLTPAPGEHRLAHRAGIGDLSTVLAVVILGEVPDAEDMAEEVLTQVTAPDGSPDKASVPAALPHDMPA